ncbi:MAG TPA: hypothetical protein VGE36_13485 [Roseateles sp.]
MRVALPPPPLILGDPLRQYRERLQQRQLEPQPPPVELRTSPFRVAAIVGPESSGMASYAALGRSTQHGDAGAGRLLSVYA